MREESGEEPSVPLMAAKVWIPTYYTCMNEVRLHIANASIHVPVSDNTFSDEQGKEKERSRKLEELEKRAPSPLTLTHSSSLNS